MDKDSGKRSQGLMMAFNITSRKCCEMDIGSNSHDVEVWKIDTLRNVAAQFRSLLTHPWWWPRWWVEVGIRVSRVIPYKEFGMLKICKEGTIKEQILELLGVRQAFQGSKLATPHQKFFQHRACVDDEFPQIPCLDHCSLQGLGAR